MAISFLNACVGWPLIGNVFDVPKYWQWLAYANWAQEHDSPLIHVNMLGTHFMVANDIATTKGLLDQKRSNFNLRPRLPMLNEAVGLGWNFGLTPDFEIWKTCRPMFQRHFRQIEARKWRPHEKRMAGALLHRLLETPDDFLHHIPYMASSLILDIVYGIKVKPENDEFVAYANSSQEGFDRSLDGWAVDVLPWLQHLPSWLPGMDWKKQTDEWKFNALAMFNVPYEWLKDELGHGRATHCLATELLNDLSGDATSSRSAEYAIKSTVAYMEAFVLAMLLFPEAQRRAHEELDRVVGDSRLPDFSDEIALPYISAIVKEVIRWGVLMPIGLPHVSAEDDIYKGYFIPKGTVILCNSWAIMKDPTTYPQPDTFLPERFLTASGQLDANVQGPEAVFGFGKRICAGRFMAHDATWYTSACILSAFAIKPKAGQPPSEPLFRPGLTLHPMPFECDIRPRSDQATRLIKGAQEMGEH
ncbi:cytochrome P450 [Amylostereum chailletii]|nr:cytochrome P450 [Amylostereum chailletii]